MRGFPRPYNLKRGEISAPARQKVDGHRVRGGVRSRLAIVSGTTRICPYGLWRHPAESYSALCNGRSSFECEDSFPEGSAILGASGSRLWDVASLATHVDISGSLLAA